MAVSLGPMFTRATRFLMEAFSRDFLVPGLYSEWESLTPRAGADLSGDGHGLAVAFGLVAGFVCAA